VRLTGDVPDSFGSLVDDHLILFLTVYDFHFPKWCVDSETTKSAIEEYLKKGVYQPEGAGSYRSAYNLH
jgi:hypothetical protein